MIRVDFATAARIVFGNGTVSQLPELVESFGEHALLVTGRNPGRISGVREGLEEAGLDCIVFPVAGEPTVSLVREGARICTASNRDLVISIGGGSAIDAGKAIAIVAQNSGEPLDYLEVVGSGQALLHPGLPFVAVPTTAGTGSEVTRNAVLGSPEHGVKASLRSPMMLAKIALVDPQLTRDLPPQITAQTGLDAFTQLLEAFVCRNANPLTDGFCEAGLARVRDALLRCYQDGHDVEARETMAYASLLSGLALSNAGLGVVHGFAGPAGGMTNAPHGAICAALLVSGMRANIGALRNREPGNASLEKYARAAKILTGNADPDALVRWTAELTARLETRGLRQLGVMRIGLTNWLRKRRRRTA